MFLHLSVSHSVHMGVLSQHALQVESQHALQQGVLSQHALQVVSQHALQGGLLPGGACSWGVPVWRHPQKQAATVADSTHPTGMHSCCNLKVDVVALCFNTACDWFRMYIFQKWCRKQIPIIFVTVKV